MSIHILTYRYVCVYRCWCRAAGSTGPSRCASAASRGSRPTTSRARTPRTSTRFFTTGIKI